MGCSSSKLDDLPAVALCRERCSFLDEAIQQGVLPRSPPSPNKLKSKAVDPIQVGSSSPKKDVISHHHSHSHSGSHLHFDSVKALNEIKASLGWRVVYAWIGDDPCGDGDLPPWSGVTCSTQGDYRVVTELYSVWECGGYLLFRNRYQFDQVTEDAMVDRLAVSPLTITTLKR
ncbi:uncharacterized protein [Gossypium hirsutum]|uniref:Uncharacterized protein isoform X1 n=1 Tax=Gossypium hirsutum TaxID=3635 RepID=A0ABM3BBH3_GOSHI|nr:uncharacterized protein LOC107945833 isoform X1 [Gossypium hirsutum]XP_040964399.1 uncharacterized protein LOC107945833 isoform X1 [Gossypium hirsutum]